jgi:hypothetical protein
VARIKNKIRDNWMSAEQQLKLAVMDSVGDTIRHIIAPPPMAFQNMSISDIIEAVHSTYGKTTRHTIKRVKAKEILTEKLDNVRNWRTPPLQASSSSAPLQASSSSTNIAASKRCESLL